MGHPHQGTGDYGCRKVNASDCNDSVVEIQKKGPIIHFHNHTLLMYTWGDVWQSPTCGANFSGG